MDTCDAVPTGAQVSGSHYVMVPLIGHATLKGSREVRTAMAEPKRHVGAGKKDLASDFGAECVAPERGGGKVQWYG